MSEYTERAYSYAVEAHTGIMRRGGEEPYHNHVRRVGDAVAKVVGISDDAIAAAYLHDVIEDTGRTAADLRAAGFTERTCWLAQQLTHDKKLSYMEYIDRLISFKDIELLYIKLKDNDDNSNVNPVYVIDGWEVYLRRYTKSKIKLIEAIITLTRHYTALN